MTLRTPLTARFGDYYLFNLRESAQRPARGALFRCGIGYFRVHASVLGFVLATRYKQWQF